MDCAPGYHICVPAAYGAPKRERDVGLFGHIMDFPQLPPGMDVEEVVGGDLQSPTGFYAHEVCTKAACLRYSLRYCPEQHQLKIYSIGYPVRYRSKAYVPEVSVTDWIDAQGASLDEVLRQVRVSVGGAPAALRPSEVGPCYGPRGEREGLHSSRSLAPDRLHPDQRPARGHQVQPLHPAAVDPQGL